MSGALGSGVEDMGAIKEDESDEMERILENADQKEDESSSTHASSPSSTESKEEVEAKSKAKP